jgi:flagellar biosynthesis/type III secretory pathway protein FliH
MSDVTETDYTTYPPTVTERDFTPEEIAQREKDQAEAKAAAAAADKQAKATAKATAEAIAHAKSLGFTDAMIAVMYPNLGA